MSRSDGHAKSNMWLRDTVSLSVNSQGANNEMIYDRLYFIPPIKSLPSCQVVWITLDKAMAAYWMVEHHNLSETPVIAVWK